MQCAGQTLLGVQCTHHVALPATHAYQADVGRFLLMVWNRVSATGLFAIGLLSIISAIAFGHKELSGLGQAWYQSRNNPQLVASSTFGGALVEPFVERPALSQQLITYLHKNNTCVYPVLYGSKGAGMTALVSHLLYNYTGAVYFNVKPAEKEEVQQLLANKLQLRQGAETLQVQSASDLIPIFVKARDLLPKQEQPKIIPPRPVVVIDVLTGATDDVTKRVLIGARYLACDASNSMSVIVVLSDATAIFAYTDDRDRRKMLWVPEFSVDEAHSHLDKHSVLIGEINRIHRQRLFDDVGRLPVRLNKFVSEHGTDANSESVTACALSEWNNTQNNLDDWVSNKAGGDPYVEVLRKVRNAASTKGSIPIDGIGVSKEELVAMIRRKRSMLLMDDKPHVQPHTMAEWHVLQKWIPPPPPPHPSVLLPPHRLAEIARMTVEEFGTTLGLHRDAVGALSSAEVVMVVLVEFARRGENALCTYLEKIPSLSQGAVGSIVVFFYPIGVGDGVQRLYD